MSNPEHTPSRKEVCDTTTVMKLADIENKIFNVEEKINAISTTIDNVEKLVKQLLKRIG